MFSVKIDIVILSYAKNDELKHLTEQTISSLLQSENPEEVEFNIVVIESNKSLAPYQYSNTATIYPSQKFGFNRYLNIGLDYTNSDLVCFCNNDLMFEKNWATEILKAMESDEQLVSASTFCPKSHKDSKLNLEHEKIEGYYTLFSGWCFLIKRSLIDVIGKFDEQFEFWYADSDYLKTLQKYGKKNFLVTKSVVRHLNASTSTVLNKRERFNYTLMPQMFYNYKWGRDSYLKYKAKVFFFKLKYFFH